VVGRLFAPIEGAVRLIGDHLSNRLEIFLCVVLRLDFEFFDRLTDHDNAAPRPNAEHKH
jgi:hypothetical protein